PSLHAHNAAGAIARLRDMGVPPGLIASTLNCIIAQRLARRLCTECCEPYTANVDGVPTPDGELLLHRAVGCAACADTGYSGRVALYEVMPIRGEIRGLIDDSAEPIFPAALPPAT